ncbi:MAG: hypothetical protein RL021_366 [Bacteroidota bacterium]|jgi:membrane associated rhomboid family serine protease
MSGMLDSIRYRLRTSDILFRLIVLNIAIFVVLRLLNAISSLFLYPFCDAGTVSDWLAVPASPVRLLYRPWTLVSYMFLHWDFQHILLNMIWLYWFGQILLEYLGPRKLSATYLAGGIAGALMYILCYNTLPLFEESRAVSVAMGASASIMAITIAAATLLPDYRLSLLFIGEVRLKWVAIVILLLDLINVSSSNAGGHIAHLGGALYGYLFIIFLRRGTDLSAWLEKLLGLFSPQGKSGKFKVVKRSSASSDEEYRTDKNRRQERVDRILDKISRSGYDSLSEEERDFLNKASQEE